MKLYIPMGGRYFGRLKHESTFGYYWMSRFQIKNRSFSFYLRPSYRNPEYGSYRYFGLTVRNIKIA